MVDDELAATLEEVLEILFAVRAVKVIVLFNLHHGKPPSLGIHAIVVLGEILFMRQKFLPLGEPLVSRKDSRMFWIVLVVISCLSFNMFIPPAVRLPRFRFEIG